MKEVMTDLLKSLCSSLQTWSPENLRTLYPTLPAMPSLSKWCVGKLFIASQVVVGLEASAQAKNVDILNYVDPLIGTTEGGKTCDQFL